MNDWSQNEEDEGHVQEHNGASGLSLFDIVSTFWIKNFKSQSIDVSNPSTRLLRSPAICDTWVHSFTLEPEKNDVFWLYRSLIIMIMEKSNCAEFFVCFFLSESLWVVRCVSLFVYYWIYASTFINDTNLLVRMNHESLRAASPFSFIHHLFLSLRLS